MVTFIPERSNGEKNKLYLQIYSKWGCIKLFVNIAIYYILHEIIYMETVFTSYKLVVGFR